MNDKMPASFKSFKGGDPVGTDAYKRFLDGDDKALMELIREYQDGLVLFLNRYVRDLNTADELCSETFIRLALRKPKFRGDASFKSFLYGIGRNAALEYIKRNKKRKTVPLDEVCEIPYEADPSRALFEKQRNSAVYRAIGKLKPEYAQVLWLTYFEDMSNKEIAHIMKKSVSAVKSLLHRAKPALKKEPEKEGLRQHRTKTALRALHASCLHIFRHFCPKLLEIRQYSCVVLGNLTKNLTAQYAHNLCAVLP